MNNNDVPIWEKYTLTIEEAAKYFVSEKVSCENWQKKIPSRTG